MEHPADYVVFIGGPCIDEYYSVDSWPRQGDKFTGRFLGSVPGGMIANAACVCAGYGVKTYCLDVRGKNKTSDFLLEDLRQHGVDPSRFVLIDGFADSKCVIFQSRSERTILVVNGDRYRIDPDDEQKRFLCGAEFVYTALIYEQRFTDFQGLLRELGQNGVKLVLDNEASTYVEGWERYLQYAHTAFFNEHSLELFRDGASERAFLEKLFALGVRIVVLTLGKEGCEVITRDERFAVPAYGVPVVDTTGAGDTFNSSFLLGLKRGWDLHKTTLFATAAANMAVMVQGPRGGVTAEEKVFQFMEENEHLLGKAT